MFDLDLKTRKDPLAFQALLCRQTASTCFTHPNDGVPCVPLSHAESACEARGWQH